MIMKKRQPSPSLSYHLHNPEPSTPQCSHPFTLPSTCNSKLPPASCPVGLSSDICRGRGGGKEKEKETRRNGKALFPINGIFNQQAYLLLLKGRFLNMNLQIFPSQKHLAPSYFNYLWPWTTSVQAFSMKSQPGLKCFLENIQVSKLYPPACNHSQRSLHSQNI